MLLSRLCRISAVWRPHSEQLKQWIAGSGNDLTKLGAARMYASELHWASAVEDAEDCTEAVVLLHKLGFSKDSSIFDALRQQVSDPAQCLTRDSLQAILLPCERDAALFDCMSSVFLTPSRHLPAFKAAFEMLDTAEKLHFARVFWEHSFSISRQQRPECWGVSSAIASSLAALLSRQPETSDAVLDALADAGLPEEDPSVRGLTDRVVEVCQGKSSHRKLQLMEKLAKSRHRGNLVSSVWFAALRDGINADGKDYFRFTALLNTADILPNRGEVRRAEQLLGQADVPCLLSFCESLEGAHDGSLRSWASCCAMVKKRALAVTRSGPSSTEEEAAMSVLCLCHVDAPSARAALSELLGKKAPSDMRAGVARHVLRCFAKVDVFPAEYVKAFASAALLDTFTREDGVYLLYASLRAGVAISPALVKKTCARWMGRHFARRKQHAANTEHGDLSPTAQVYLAASVGCLVMEQHGINGEKVASEMMEQRDLAMGGGGGGALLLLLETMAKLQTPELPRRMAVVRGMRGLDDRSTEAVLRALLDAMRAAGFRDAGGYGSVLQQLTRSSPSLEPSSVLSAASAAHALHLMPQFERARVLECVSDFGAWSKEDLTRLAKLCTASQRRQLMGMPGVKETLMSGARADVADSDKILLFNMAPDDKKLDILQTISRDTKPDTSGNISAEDAVAALENVQRLDSAQFEVVFRLVSRALEGIDEYQLMRVLQCLSQLPSCPSYAFRTLGKSILHLADTMSANNAVIWLGFYTRNRIRDDSVGKALIKKASSKHASLSPSAAQQLLQGASFYGQAVKAQRACKKRRQAERSVRLPGSM